MFILKEATGTILANKREKLAKNIMGDANNQFRQLGTPPLSPEDWLLFYCDMLKPMLHGSGK